MKRLLVCGVVLVSAVLVYGQTPRPQQQRPAATASTVAAQRAVIDQYCIGCHNEKTKNGGLALDKVDLEHVGDSPEMWEKVTRKLRTREMPPPGRPRRDADGKRHPA